MPVSAISEEQVVQLVAAKRLSGALLLLQLATTNVLWQHYPRFYVFLYCFFFMIFAYFLHFLDFSVPRKKLAGRAPNGAGTLFSGIKEPCGHFGQNGF